MGRWTQYDEDDYRLPEGMERIGYDADTGKYQFRDQNRSIWEGPEGARFGELTCVSKAATAVRDSSPDGDEELAGPLRTDGYQPLAMDANVSPHHGQQQNAGAYRTLFPFFLLICVVLLLIWRFIISPSHAGSSDANRCLEPWFPFKVESGDTCWDIGDRCGFTVDEIMVSNPGLQCETLTPGQIICLPYDWDEDE